MRPVDVGWIRVFVEVAARGSLSAAARQLSLTQPAVSYQMRRAENELGVPLLRRVHRGTELTEAGRRLAEILTPAVAQVDMLARELRQNPAKRVLRLYTDFAFSALWLIPRMHRFRERFPDLELQVIATQHTALRDLCPGDTAVIFGALNQIEGPCELLLSECVVPVCTPAFAKAHGTALERAPLIHLDSTLAPAKWFDWTRYLSETGKTRPDAQERGLHFNTYSLVIEATLAGQGVALGWRGLIDSMLSRKMLVEAGASLTNADQGYLLVQHGAHDPAAAHLRTFLLEESAR
ncbi:putative choline sulfate-utilization transcription factor [Rhodobacter sp. JA431]|uniref:LysR family transcriptional regulator n=1 Tax=Rhodobacter sp. JA431 TaxID=570013 RepID=UPI000BC4F2D2|nr:LysR family transcriptional regulator [Rhodobacter sp. JA431]SOB99851.1 putative choline sulfate-utilization transcription factor [Rhodobacter sp. JA431]